MTPKPTLVFCPGAWHTPSCFAPTTDLLSAAGYQISLVSLQSVGSELRGEDPQQNWDADIAAIRATVIPHLDRGEDVVLVVHSYGGLIGSEAAKGLDRKSRDQDGQGAIIAMAYLASVVLDIGGAVLPDGKPNPDTRYSTKVSPFACIGS
jgi:alpha-beta hydrolase superfamily lysophospholipase